MTSLDCLLIASPKSAKELIMARIGGKKNLFAILNFGRKIARLIPTQALASAIKVKAQLTLSKQEEDRKSPVQFGARLVSLLEYSD